MGHQVLTRLTPPAYHVCRVRLYREWAELHGSLLEGRPHPPNQVERALLRGQGRRALDTLLSVIRHQSLADVAQEFSVLEVRAPKIAPHALA